MMFLWLLHTVDLACPHARRMLLPSRILKQNGTQLPYRAIPRRTAPYRTRSHAPFSATDGSRPRVVGRAAGPTLAHSHLNVRGLGQLKTLQLPGYWPMACELSMRRLWGRSKACGKTLHNLQPCIEYVVESDS